MKSFKSTLCIVAILFYPCFILADDIMIMTPQNEKGDFWAGDKSSPNPKYDTRLDMLREETVKPYVLKNLATLPVNPAMTELWSGNSSVRFSLNGHMYSMFANTFMHKTKPDEVCSWLKAEKNGLPNYQCPEGQPLHFDCHFYFVNDDSQIKAVHIAKLSIPESSRPPFCQTVLGVGAANKTAPALMVTVQYFNTESPVAKTASQLGSNWLRSTLLFRLQEKDGELVVTQDDSCLGNPNKFETIPDARKAFKQRGCK
ncbi:hypothetical protein [Methylovorus glucosotrophus]|uniref:Uncharacterized protein n=1 Tax=Methylovorus glucosotrophus (strain SIP3-4) TaxID=582744 RepID=C6X816_METGS|nr:hypothetical protein [Methylovorus glucosotrophus]ACT51343.1 hypothetical protein Msip34_2101 [Methylovorus glucosotrophus SIP3-4]